MRKTVIFGLVAALMLVPAAGAMAESGTAWLHVRVEEAQKGSKVRVNLPMTVVEAALKATPHLIEEHGKVKLGDHHGMKLSDFRTLWAELAAVGDAEFVTVESEDENVRVCRKGDLVQIFVDRKGKEAAEGTKAEAEKPAKGKGQVRVEVPVSLVDALLSGEGEELNIEAAVAELQKQRGDIVRVKEADNQVHVWIDEQNTQTAAR